MFISLECAASPPKSGAEYGYSSVAVADVVGRAVFIVVVVKLLVVVVVVQVRGRCVSRLLEYLHCDPDRSASKFETGPGGYAASSSSTLQVPLTCA